MSGDETPRRWTNDELIAMSEDEAPDWMTIDELVAWNIKSLREEANLSLREAAILMTVWHYEPWTYQRFYRREQVATPVTVAELHALANLFGVSLFRFLRCPRHIQFLQINGLLIRAEDYKPDYLFDVDGRTGEAWRVSYESRMAIIKRRVRKESKSGTPFAPGLVDGMPPTGDLKRLAAALAPIAEEMWQSRKKGKKNGDSTKD
jgi:transcriptional regulator with XRE-family HTH domain